MKAYKIFVPLAAALFIFSCKNKNQGLNVTISPDAGTTYNAGTELVVKAGYGKDVKPDSVVYLMDSARVAVQKDSAVVKLKTDTMKLGVKVITARVYAQGNMDEASTNVVIVAAKAPDLLTYEVVKTFPHDTTSFTEGLEYHDGFLYESDGGYVSDEGQSSLRKVNITTGKPVQKIDIDPKVFAEGITILDGKIIQLTYHEKVAYRYDLASMKLLATLPFNAAPEGWGLCNDGKQLYATVGSGSGEGTNQILILNKDNLQKTGDIDVYDDKGPVSNLNELELINGKLYANVWQTNFIIVINPKTGAVEQKIDLGTLYPEPRIAPADVLNGIAYDKAGNRIFITGKKWQHLYQVKFVE
ncbi:glutaminyl-peptide cyclotransferase [Mucilaginibacter sp. KACC 22063]|uniref:glutaminyl-peptide cyclotransferase n=1 Tax=Mucilaginibacter sp. KACC 22063 TaxID=3025666 RepID=UPI002365CB01|nr:glutaminyl-peptide cyclotransferase [Mucilaginibacter sp. KACC 22063]WDF56271.1 glutaminyl-peptide cyclotransferase [Mucilaginibacter sp. KACC 22063]